MQNAPRCYICEELLTLSNRNRGEIAWHYEGFGTHDPNKRQVPCHKECVELTAMDFPEAITHIQASTLSILEAANE